MSKDGARLLKLPVYTRVRNDVLLDLLEGLLIAAGIQAENKQGPRLHGATQYFQIVTDEGE